MANEKNLKPQSARTKAEQRKIASAGGIASGAARREKRTLRHCLEILLSRSVSVDGEEMTGAEAAAAAVYSRVISGDVRAFEVIRDTVGEKPTDKIDNTHSGGLVITWQDSE